jgi:methyl-accepting chemotaxis protein
LVASEVKNLATQTARATDEIASQIEGVQLSTQSAIEAIREISAQAHQTSSLVNGAMQITTTTDQDVLRLGEATDRIGSVLDLIRQIAQQTNLLALNATIESARAGEAGKGFAVLTGAIAAAVEEQTAATQEIAQNVSAATDR